MLAQKTTAGPKNWVCLYTDPLLKKGHGSCIINTDLDIRNTNGGDPSWECIRLQNGTSLLWAANICKQWNVWDAMHQGHPYVLQLIENLPNSFPYCDCLAICQLQDTSCRPSHRSHSLYHSPALEPAPKITWIVISFHSWKKDKGLATHVRTMDTNKPPQSSNPPLLQDLKEHVEHSNQPCKVQGSSGH